MHSYLQNGRRVIKGAQLHICFAKLQSPSFKERQKRRKKMTEPRTEKKKLSRKCICLYLLFSYGKKDLVSMTRGPGFLHTHYTIRLSLFKIFAIRFTASDTLILYTIRIGLRSTFRDLLLNVRLKSSFGARVFATERAMLFSRCLVSNFSHEIYSLSSFFCKIVVNKT